MTSRNFRLIEHSYEAEKNLDFKNVEFMIISLKYIYIVAYIGRCRLYYKIEPEIGQSSRRLNNIRDTK